MPPIFNACSVSFAFANTDPAPKSFIGLFDDGKNERKSGGLVSLFPGVVKNSSISPGALKTPFATPEENPPIFQK